MKPILAITIILMAILALAAGSFAMSRMINLNDHANCLAAIPGSVKCIGGMDPIQFAITHINALLGISLGVVSSLVVALFTSVVLLLWLAASDIFSPLSTASNYLRISIERIARSIHKQRRWISMHEKRDPSLAFAASP